MAFCAHCGAALNQETGFCASCGKPVGAGAPATQVVSTSSPAATGTSSGLTSNLAAALAYALGFITGILFLVLEPYKHDRFVRFHAMQSIFFSAGCLAFSIAWSIMVGILAGISGWMALATFPIRLLISLGFFLLWLYVIYQAYSQREYHIPFIGDLAAKQVA